MNEQEKREFYAPGKDWIQTNSGQKFWPLDPQPDTIRLADITHALSMQVRFTGHLNAFYSVAEHSVRVADFTRVLGGDDTDYKQALLHDASEGYLCDIASPVKRSPEFAGYRAAEEKLQKAIYRKYGLPEEMRPLVKQADLIMLKLEALKLLDSRQPEWKLHLDKIDVPRNELDLRLGWEWKSARDVMRARLAEYWGSKC